MISGPHTHPASVDGVSVVAVALFTLAHIGLAYAAIVYPEVPRYLAQYAVAMTLLCVVATAVVVAKWRKARRR